MAGQQEVDIVIIIFGTLGMLILAMALVAFVILYQKKRLRMHAEKIERENLYQRELLNSIIEVREIEQKRIALDLHDNIGSRINGVKMRLNKSNITAEDINAANQELKELVKQVREISHDLLPPVLNEYGLNGALKNLCRRCFEESEIEVNCYVDEKIKLNFTPNESLALYRITQEIFNNIIKHANANKISLNSFLYDDYFVIQIEDNGIGFVAPKELDFKSKSLGLKNIASRIQQINATITYEKIDTQGTRVTIKLNNHANR